MLGFDLVVVTFAACCAWLGPAAEALLPARPQGVSKSAMQPMKGRAVAIELGPAYTESGMTDPAGEIANPLAASLADRYGLRFEPGRPAAADALVLGMHTLEWVVVAGIKDYQLRYRGEATLVDRADGRTLGRAWCDRRVSTGKNSYDASLADRPALAGALGAAASSCGQQLKESLLGG